MDWRFVAFGGAYAFAAGIQPGPYQAFLLGEALHRGVRRTLPASFAPVLSDGPIAIVVLTVLSRVPASWVGALQVLGGGFLFFLALGAFRAWRRGPREPGEGCGTRRTTLLKATVVNFLNPNPWMGWSLVMGPALVRAWSHSAATALGLLVSFYGVLVATVACTIALFAAAGRVGPKVSRALLGFSAVALVAFGVLQFVLGIRALAR